MPPNNSRLNKRERRLAARRASEERENNRWSNRLRRSFAGILDISRDKIQSLRHSTLEGQVEVRVQEEPIDTELIIRQSERLQRIQRFMAAGQGNDIDEVASTLSPQEDRALFRALILGIKEWNISDHPSAGTEGMVGKSSRERDV